MTAPTRHSRRWFRFSLRSLFVVVTLFAIWLAWCVNSARRQRETMAAIRKLDPQVEFFYSFQRTNAGTEFEYDPDIESPLPAVLVSALGNDFFYRVSAVYLYVGKEEGVASLTGFPGLRSLVLTEPIISAAERLNDLPRLEELCVILSPDPEPPRQTVGFLEWLFGTKKPEPPSPPPKPPRQNALFGDIPPLPALKRLFVGGEIDDSGLADLERFPQLESFESFWDPISDDGLRQLASAPRLKRLKIDGPVTDNGIQYLLQMKNLETLSLSSSKITAAGLLRLKSHPRLRQLAIPSNLSAEAAALGQELPNCKITVN